MSARSRSSHPARDGGARPLRDLGRRRPINFGGRAFGVLMALIEVSGALSTDQLLSRVGQGSIVDQNRQARHEPAQSARPPQSRHTS